MKKYITRKNFIKNSMLTVGLLPFHNLLNWNSDINPVMISNSEDLESKTYTTTSNIQTIRGSWIQRGAIQPDDIILASAGNACRIVVGNKEHSAVHQAATFLAKDIDNISGCLPEIVNQPDKSAMNIILVTLGNSPLPSDIPLKELKGAWEAFQVYIHDNTVWLIGSDFRGTAFASYTLSERLGIDPLYIWSGYKPEKFKQLTLKKIDYFASSPTFKYRGYFHDDEDILPRPFEANEYPVRVGDVPMEWYQRYFETALRLRFNMVAPYTRVHRRYEVQECANKWGLFYTSHHYDILLSNPFGIERFNLAEKRGINPDWDWYKNKEGMKKYWYGGVEENKNLDAIWPVGLRGTDDHAYAFPENTSEKEQSIVFQEVIDSQIQMVKKSLPRGHPSIFHFTLYAEMLEKYNNNNSTLNLPEDIIIVWPDDNDGGMRALPLDRGKWKHGVYYHLSYFGGTQTKQSTHVVSPERITSQFKKIINSGATEFMLVNVSELREFIMEGRLLAEICFDGKNIMEADNPSEYYTKWWTNEYFGTQAAESAEKAYKHYYNIVAKSESMWLGTLMVEDILDKLSKKNREEKFEPIKPGDIATLKDHDTKYQTAMNSINIASNKMDAAQQQFFFEQVTIGLLFDWRPTQAALSLAKALSENDLQKSWLYIEEARKYLEQLEIEILRAERPPFEKWYRATFIRKKESPFNIHRSFEQVRSFIVSGGTESPVKPKILAGHSIPAAKIWTKFLEDSEKLPNSIL